MAVKPETLFRQRVDKKLKAIPNSWWESIQQRTIRGTPDKIGVVNGWFVALELKASFKNKPTALQQRKLDLINKCSGVAYVVHPGNLDDVFNILLDLNS